MGWALIANFDLRCKCLHNGLRHGSRIFEERTEKSHGGQLQGVAETGEVPTFEVNPFQIVVVQVKIGLCCKKQEA